MSPSAGTSAASAGADRWKDVVRSRCALSVDALAEDGRQVLLASFVSVGSLPCPLEAEAEIRRSASDPEDFGDGSFMFRVVDPDLAAEFDVTEHACSWSGRHAASVDAAGSTETRSISLQCASKSRKNGSIEWKWAMEARDEKPASGDETRAVQISVDSKVGGAELAIRASTTIRGTAVVDSTLLVNGRSARPEELAILPPTPFL